MFLVDFKKVLTACLLFCSILITTSIGASVGHDFKERFSSLDQQEKYQRDFENIYSNNIDIGNRSYDLSLGKAALKANKPDEAVIACERVLINAPNDPDARLCLSNAYYNLKLYDKAQKEIELLLSKPSSKIIKEEALKLSQFTSAKIRSENRPYRFYGKVAYGYDNNVATTTDEDYVKYLKLVGFNKEPILGPFYNQQVVALNDLYSKLRENNLKLKSAYLYPMIGVEGKHNSSNSKYSVFWDINGSHKWYTDVSNYDVSQANAAFGLNYQPNGSYLLNGTVYYQEYLVNDSRYREVPMVSFGVSRALDANNTIRIYTDDGLLIYPNDRSQTVYMYSGGLEWQFVYGRNILVTQLFSGRDQPRGGSDASNGDNYYGGEIALKYKLTGRTNITTGFMYQNSLYDEVDANLPNSDRRRDSYFQITAGIYHLLESNVVWYTTAIYAENRSKVFTYEYSRFEALTGISFEF